MRGALRCLYADDDGAVEIGTLKVLSYTEYATRFDGVLNRSSLDRDSALGAAWSIGDQCVEQAKVRLKQGSSKSKVVAAFATSIFQRPQLNAIATQLEDRYAVALFWPLVFSLQGVAAAIWANPLTAPWVGDIAQLPPIVNPKGGFPPGMELYLAQQGKIEFVPAAFRSGVPIQYVDAIIRAGDERWELFLATWKAAIEFIWNHEIAHILYGHVDLAQRLFGIDLLYEGEGLSGNLGPNALAHFMEYVADVDGALQLYAGFYTQLLEAPADPDRSSAYQVGAATTLGIVLAIYVLNQGVSTHGKAESVSLTHPPLVFRAHWILGAEELAFSTAAKRSNLVMEQARDIAHAARQAIDALLASVAMTHGSLASWLGRVDDDGEAKTNDYLAGLHTQSSPWFDQLASLQKV